MACPKCDSFDVRNAHSGVFRNECICNNCQYQFRTRSSAVIRVGQTALIATGGVAVSAAVVAIAPVLGITTLGAALLTAGTTVGAVAIKGLASGQTVAEAVKTLNPLG